MSRFLACGCYRSRVLRCHLIPAPAMRPTFAQEERTQGRNRERAMALLRAKLFELELEKQRRCAVVWCCPVVLWLNCAMRSCQLYAPAV